MKMPSADFASSKTFGRIRHEPPRDECLPVEFRVGAPVRLEPAQSDPLRSEQPSSGNEAWSPAAPMPTAVLVVCGARTSSIQDLSGGAESP